MVGAGDMILRDFGFFACTIVCSRMKFGSLCFDLHLLLHHNMWAGVGYPPSLPFNLLRFSSIYLFDHVRTAGRSNRVGRLK